MTTPTAANTITKIGGGDLALAGANTYAGVTLVADGNLIVQNPNALGSAGTAGTEVLFLQDPVANLTQFTLSYLGASSPTTAISYTGNGAVDAAAIQSALSATGFLPTGGTVVSVTADPTDTKFTIVLGGTLAGTIQPIFTVRSPRAPAPASRPSVRLHLRRKRRRHRIAIQPRS